jgi:hypothetical protein
MLQIRNAIRKVKVEDGNTIAEFLEENKRENPVQWLKALTLKTYYHS